MTAHKAQGKTLAVVILDLEGTSWTESPYVMLSRAKSLDGVFILRPFNQKVVQRHPSQEVRNKFRRLDMLCHQTIMQYGTTEEAAAAQRYLVENFSAQALPEVEEPMEETVDDDAHRLACLQSRLIATAPPLVMDPAASSSLGSSGPRRRARIVKTSGTDVGRTSKRAYPDDDKLAPPPPKRTRRERIKRR
ncbi:hypothetical protein B0H10DRAFT_728804 [Mycena sp. CBHHK59/15]|nr:hypothetical protein B0H10DRAFT_728804 [Mycena sp. CBHHK59/15]